MSNEEVPLGDKAEGTDICMVCRFTPDKCICSGPRTSEQLSRPEIVSHDLKCWPEFFEHVWNGSKPFEIREDDRDFRVGDWLRLREWNPKTNKYTGRECTKRVTYITDWAQRNDYVVIGLGR